MKSFLFFIIVLFSTQIWAQTYTLNGKVLANDKGLEYVSVGIQDLGKVSQTASDGTFTLENLPSGRFLLQVSLIGYERKKIWVQPEKQDFVSIQLTPLQNNLGEITISGNLREVSKSESAVPVEIYGQQFFKKLPNNNLFESMQMINGVLPTLNCNVCATGDIQINGMDGPYTLVLIDGMPIISALSSVYGLSGIPNALIEKVEVVKGPAATLYGSEAMGGLINVITKSASAAPKLAVNYFASSYAEQNLDVGLGIKGKKVNALYGLNLFHYNWRQDVNGDNFTDIPVQTRVSLFGKWQFKRKDNLSSSLAARLYYEDRFGGEMNWDKRFRGGDSVYGESIYTKRLELLGLHPFKIKNELFKFQFSFNLHNQDAAYGTTKLLAQQMGLFNQLIHDRKLNNKHRLLSGLTLRYTHYQDDAPVRLGNSFVQQFVIPGAFVQEEFTPNNRQTILMGARVDYYNFHGFIFSPRANYKWQINSNNALRISAGNGFRIVNIFTEDHAALTGAREIVIAEDLKPEKTWNMNVNYSSWRNQKQGFLEWDISAFYTWFGNKIIPDYDQDPNKIVYQNLSGYAVSRGITLNTEASFVFPLKINAGFTLMDVFAQQTDSLGNSFRQVQMHAPRFSGTFQISYAWKPVGLTLDYTGQVYGPMRLPILPNDFRPEYSPWFSLQNVQLTKKFGPKFECYASIKNIWNFLPAHPLIRWWDPFDKRVDNVNDNPQGYQFDAGYNFAPMQGRTFLFGLRYLLP